MFENFPFEDKNFNSEEALSDPVVKILFYLVRAIPDPEKLLLVAEYLDVVDSMRGDTNNEVQTWLRECAQKARDAKTIVHEEYEKLPSVKDKKYFSDN